MNELFFLDCTDFVFLLCFMAFYGYYVHLPEDKCEMRSRTIYCTNINKKVVLEIHITVVM